MCLVYLFRLLGYIMIKVLEISIEIAQTVNNQTNLEDVIKIENFGYFNCSKYFESIFA